jgi:diaminopimelate epimerase
LKLRFYKYHGTGNDFIMVDSRKNVMPDQSPRLISRLCDRHFGIGADGLIILEPSENHDFRMRYFNADGYPGTMCGNGGRCITAFARKSGWTISNCTFEAADGIHRAAVLPDGQVQLEMRDVRGVKKIEEGYVLDTGSPHLVIFRNGVEQLDVTGLGRKYRHDPQFIGGTNVNFVERTDRGIMVRTFERGVEDETLSCGTGVTASAIAAFLEHDTLGKFIEVRTPGGVLRVEFAPDSARKVFREIFLTGPATEVFSGEVNL